MVRTLSHSACSRRAGMVLTFSREVLRSDISDVVSSDAWDGWMGDMRVAVKDAEAMLEKKDLRDDTVESDDD